MSRRQYTTEYKKQAVQLSHQRGKSVALVAKELGIAENNLWRWREQYAVENDHVVPRNTLTPEQEEIRRLQKALAEVTEERDILKKTVGIFSRLKRDAP